MFRALVFFLVVFIVENTKAQETKLALLKYNGGGDWYANLQTSLPNLISFANGQMNMNIASEQAIVEPGSNELFAYPFIHMTGHGNVVLSSQEANNMRTYLLAGGFLHIDDNYGMDPFIQLVVKQLFPDNPLISIPVDHKIFNEPYRFPDGLPKIHAHDNKPPEVLGIFHEGRLLLLYTKEADLGDGWENPEVHGDTEENHTKALKMGVNILYYAFMGSNEQ